MLNLFGPKIKGTVVLMQKNVLDINSITSAEGIIDTTVDGVGSIFDTLTSFLGRSVSLQLISATKADCKFFHSSPSCKNLIYPSLFLFFSKVHREVFKQNIKSYFFFFLPVNVSWFMELQNVFFFHLEKFSLEVSRKK